MDTGSEKTSSHRDLVNAINANSHPQARIMYTALDKVYQKRQSKQPMKSPLKVNRDHHFAHPPFTFNLTPRPTV